MKIGQGKLYAPTDGMVIYATSSRGGASHEDRRPLADGVEVWERQELIYLPRSTSTWRRWPCTKRACRRCAWVCRPS